MSEPVNLSIESEQKLKKKAFWTSRWPRSCWGYSWFSRRFPIIKWIRQYKKRDIIYDIIAGLTVVSKAIPQCISHAGVAGLEPQRGLYTEILPSMIYLLLGSTSYTILGTSSVTALLFRPVVDLGFAYGTLLTFLYGILIFCIGLLQLGFLVDFISLPVVSGFVSAATITIITHQLFPLTGLPTATYGQGFIESWESIFSQFKDIRCGDTLTGILTILLIVGLKSLERITILPIFWKLLSNARYLILIVTGTSIAYAYHLSDCELPFYITGSVIEGELPFVLPQFSTLTSDNTTVTFFEMVEGIGLRIIVVPLVSVGQLFVVAKIFADGERIHVNQEMMTLGVINVCGSFVSAMPVSASFSRTAINIAAGARSPFSGLITPITVLIAIYFWSDGFYYIPKAVLAGILICAVSPLIDLQMPVHLWSTKRKDLIPMAGTFFASLYFSPTTGIFVGIILNLFFVLHRNARPKISCELFEISGERVLVLSPYQDLYFPAAEAVLHKITQCSSAHAQEATIIVLNGYLIKRIDSSVAESFATFYNVIKRSSDKKFIFWNWETQPKNILISTEPRFEMLFRDSRNLETLLESMDIVVPFDLTARPFYYR